MNFADILLPYISRNFYPSNTAKYIPPIKFMTKHFMFSLKVYPSPEYFTWPLFAMVMTLYVWTHRSVAAKPKHNCVTFFCRFWAVFKIWRFWHLSQWVIKENYGVIICLHFFPLTGFVFHSTHPGENNGCFGKTMIRRKGFNFGTNSMCDSF